MTNYDTWKSTDTIGDEEAGREQWRARVEDDERERRWLEFEAWARTQHLPNLLRVMANLLTAGPTWNPATARAAAERLNAFADTEGWSGVLAALARALAAHQP